MLIRTFVTLAVLIAAAGPSQAVDWQSDETLSDAQVLIERESWPAAIAMLKRIVADAPENADALNLLGYSLRRNGDLRLAEGLYLKALAIEPTHIGANAYLGALYVEKGDLTKASERLAVLESNCAEDCLPALELEAAIAAAQP